MCVCAGIRIYVVVNHVHALSFPTYSFHLTLYPCMFIPNLSLEAQYSKKPCVYIQRHIPVFWELCTEISHPETFDRPGLFVKERRERLEEEEESQNTHIW